AYSIEKGKIFVENGESYHWHSSSILSLVASNDGVSLLSGGDESVLVRWNLETREKNFLHRVGSKIKSIASSPFGALSAITTFGNQIHVVSASDFKVYCSIEGIEVPKSVPMGMVVQDSKIFMNGFPGFIESFDL